MKVYNVEEIVLRIKKGKYHDKSLKIYTKDDIENVIKILIAYEKYEDCQFLKEFISERF